MTMKLSSPKEEKLWLKNLEKDLRQDRRDEPVQASPLFYTILDKREHVVPADCDYDYIRLYDADSCSYMTPVEWLDEAAASDSKFTDECSKQLEWCGVALDKDFHLIRDENGMPTAKHPDRLADFAQEMEPDLSITYISKDAEIAYDTCFFTRKEAKRHLKDNYYHYDSGAVTYGMTAWRSPQFEHALELLHRIDWDNSDIKLLPPDQWTPKSDAHKICYNAVVKSAGDANLDLSHEETADLTVDLSERLRRMFVDTGFKETSDTYIDTRNINSLAEWLVKDYIKKYKDQSGDSDANDA